jgi:uncharacterized protein (DUF305 family)
MPDTTGVLRPNSSAPACKPHSFRILASIFLAALCGLPPAITHAQQAASGSPAIVQPGAPGTPSKTLPPSTSATAPRASQADIEFMQGMIMHHQQAVEMTALIPSHTENKEVRAIGARISRSQSDEINFMKRWLVARGLPTSMAMPGMPDMDKNGHSMLMPGMLTPQQMEALRQARGAEFDRLFLTGMIQHHGGALVMVKELFESPGAGQDADLFDFVTDVDSGQRAEIRIMENMLKEKQ